MHIYHKGKVLFTATNINYAYHKQPLWKDHLNFQITSGERVALKGTNGSGKTTLIKLILGDIEPQTGTIYRADNKSVYIDQDYSLLDNKLKVYEQAQQFNVAALQEHEIKIRLNRFLFTLKSATKLFSVLLASKRPLITELADKLRLKYPLLPTISPCPTMRLEAIRSIIPISCRRYPKSV